MDIQQTVAAGEQSLTEIGMVLGAIIIISFAFSYALTHFAKRWRSEHDQTARSLSGSLIRATLLAFVSFIGLWYAAFSLGAIQTHSWTVAVIIGCIISPIAPLSWNPLIALVGKYSEAARDALKGDQ